MKGEGHPMWKGRGALPRTKRNRAPRWFALRPCDDCGGAARDRHHKDGDVGNNHPSNIAILCRRCLRAGEARPASLIRAARGRRPQ